MKPTILLFLLVFSIPSMAADKNGAHWSVGDLTCGEWHEARDKDSAEMFKAWMAGYFSSYNNSTEDVFNILGTTDMKSTYLWMYKHCLENPLSTLPHLIRDLIIELHPNRITSQP